MVCKRAQYIYTHIYIRIVRDVYVSRSRSWKIMVNGPTGGRRSNDTASSINFHLFFRLVNLNTVTKIRLDIYADISRPVYIRSNGSRAPRILKEKKKIGRILYFIPPTTSFISATDYYYVTRTISVAPLRSGSARRKRIGIGDVTEGSKASSKRSHCIEGWNRTVTEYGWPLYGGAKINRHTRIGYAFKGWRA